MDGYYKHFLSSIFFFGLGAYRIMRRKKKTILIIIIIIIIIIVIIIITVVLVLWSACLTISQELACSISISHSFEVSFIEVYEERSTPSFLRTNYVVTWLRSIGSDQEILYWIELLEHDVYHIL